MKHRSLSLAIPLILVAAVAGSGCTTDTTGGDGDGDMSVATGGDGFGAGVGGNGLPGAGGVPLGSGGGFGSGGLATGGNGTGGDGLSTGGQGTGGSEPTGSDGCGMSPSQQLDSWQTSSVNPGPGDRNYGVFLPENYDPMRPYPVILLLHGCGGGTNNVPMENQTGEDAIVIRGTGSDGTCWYTSPSDPDIPYIDAMLEDVQDRFCVDPDSLFAVGYSSGSWVASMLSCIRGDVFRGIATVTGGEPSGIANCMGQVGRMYIHDENDNDNLIAWDEPSRNRMIDTNNCSMNTAPVDPSPCVEYQGCDPGYPVVWCKTSGQGHSRQDQLAAPAFWNFFQRLMNE